MNNAHILGTERIGKLLVQYSIPAIIGMTITSLYNIIDSIFIGHGVGPMGIAGLAITFPLMNLVETPEYFLLTAEVPGVDISDLEVTAAGGRFYFAKDSTLSPESYAPYLREEGTRRFLELKQRLDPDALLQTDLYRRIFRPSPAP